MQVSQIVDGHQAQRRVDKGEDVSRYEENIGWVAGHLPREPDVSPETGERDGAQFGAVQQGHQGRGRWSTEI
jgi:hypothetical protein